MHFFAWMENPDERKKEDTVACSSAKIARSRLVSSLSIFHFLIETIDQRHRSKRMADLKIGTTFSDREVLRQFATEPDQFATYFEIQIKTRNGNRVDGIGTFSSLALRRRWRGGSRAREEAERVVGCRYWEAARRRRGKSQRRGALTCTRLSKFKFTIRRAAACLARLHLVPCSPCVRRVVS